MKKILIFFVLINFTTIFAPKPKTVLIIGEKDSGKGNVSYKAGERALIVVAGPGGTQQGRKVRKGEIKYNLKLLSTGILRNSDVQCYLMAGIEIDPSVLFSEIDYLKGKSKSVEGRLKISAKAHVVMPYHRQLDSLMAKKYKTSIDIGARKGTGAAAADKRLRIGIRVADLLDKERFKEVLKEQLHYANEKLVKLFDEKPFDFNEIYNLYNEYARRLKPFVVDNLELELNKKIAQGVPVLFEGSQGVNQDVSLGNYPYVSPSSTCASGVCVGAGVPPKAITYVVAVVPCHATAPLSCPFPTEIKDEKIIEELKKSHEKTCNDSNNQRYGWIDLVQVRQMILLNGVDSLAITKLDSLDNFDEIKICYDYLIGEKHYDSLPTLISDAKKIKPHYITMPGWKTSTQKITKFSELPENARAFIKKIEVLTGTPISYISVGPDRKQMIVMNDLLPL